MKGKKTGTLHLKLMLPKSNCLACLSCSAVLCVEKVWRKNATLWTTLRISTFRARSSTNVPAAEKSWNPKKPWTTMSGHTKMYDETKTNIENKLLHIANLLDPWGLRVGTIRCFFLPVYDGAQRWCNLWTKMNSSLLKLKPATSWLWQHYWWTRTSRDVVQVTHATNKRNR